MSHGPQLNLVTATVRTITNHPGVVSTTPNSWMMFGFLVAMMLLGTFSLHGRSARLLLVRAVCLEALAVYGFAEGIWPLGMAVAFMGIRQFAELRASGAGYWPTAASRPCGNPLFARQNRIRGLFGFDDAPEIKPRTAKSKLSDETFRLDDFMN